MKILDTISIKYDFRDIVKDADFICNKAVACLNPLIDVYIYGDIAHTYPEVKASLQTLSLYLNQLHRLETDIKTHYNQNSDVLKGKKYTALYNEALNSIQNVHNEIALIHQQILESGNCNKSNHLCSAVKLLEKLETLIKESQQTL